MKVKGIYTRCLLIQKMKMIYELKFANSKLGCGERLYYLYREILNKRMPVYVETMGWLKKNVLEQGDDENKETGWGEGDFRGTKGDVDRADEAWQRHSEEVSWQILQMEKKITLQSRNQEITGKVKEKNEVKGGG